MNRILILLIVLMFSSSSNACSCVETKLEDYYSSCKQLFTATLFNAKVSDKDGSSIIGELRNPRDILKGDTSKIKGLRTAMMGTSCETQLQVGERYLICGNDEPYIGVTSCSKTTPIFWNFSQDKIEQLKLLKEEFNKVLKEDAENKSSAF